MDRVFSVTFKTPSGGGIVLQGTNCQLICDGTYVTMPVRGDADISLGSDGQLAFIGNVAPDYILMQNSQASGTNGGSKVAFTETDYPVNTLVMDTGSHCTFNGPTFVLDAGAYEVGHVLYRWFRPIDFD